MSAGCDTCGAPTRRGPPRLHDPGTARRTLVSPEEQRESLDQFRKAMARAQERRHDITLAPSVVGFLAAVVAGGVAGEGPLG